MIFIVLHFFQHPHGPGYSTYPKQNDAHLTYQPAPLVDSLIYMFQFRLQTKNTHNPLVGVTFYKRPVNNKRANFQNSFQATVEPTLLPNKFLRSRALHSSQAFSLVSVGNRSFPSGFCPSDMKIISNSMPDDCHNLVYRPPECNAQFRELDPG